jgi:hypothetical protein
MGERRLQQAYRNRGAVDRLPDVSTTDKIRKTANFYSTLLLVEWRNLIWPLVRHRFEKPVFIVGCSRSGTTVGYKVLSMAKRLASLEKESHDFWNSLHPPEEKNWDSHSLDAEDVSERDRMDVSRYFFKHLGMRRFVDKANQNCFRIPYLLELFPDAIFIYVKRDGRDNVNSLIHGWGKPDEFAAWSRSLPYDVEVDNGQYRRWCFFLFPGWRNYLQSPVEEVCAQQWISANGSVISFHTQEPGMDWIEIFYEDLLSRPLEIFRELFERLDIPFTDDVKDHCSDLLSNPYNVFSPPRLNKWEEENTERIERIIPVIQDTMMKMGYRI